MDLIDAVRLVQRFSGPSLTATISRLEVGFSGAGAVRAAEVSAAESIGVPLVRAALQLKCAANQIHVLIHAIGIVTALPSILLPDESIESLSLGAGNTGRKFDLVTNQQVAEFKFIRWRGGAESIRQNGLFKDFFNLAGTRTRKRRRLYLLDLAHPIAFLTGGRNLSSVTSKNATLRDQLRSIHGERFETVGEYFAVRRKRVQLVDLLQLVPALAFLPGEMEIRT